MFHYYIKSSSKFFKKSNPITTLYSEGSIPLSSNINRSLNLYQRQGKRFESRKFQNMAEVKEFPPQKIRAIVAEVAALLKEKKETVSIAETVSLPSSVTRTHKISSGLKAIRCPTYCILDLAYKLL